MKSVFSRITHHASRITHHASFKPKKSSIGSWLLAILFIPFAPNLIIGQVCNQNNGINSSKNFTTLKNTIPKTKFAANFGKVNAEIPRIKDIIGVNALSTDDAGFENYKGIGVDGH